MHTSVVCPSDVARSFGVDEVIASFDEASNQIRQVVTLIRRVAAQSQSLALNATIEAACVGDGGRGFAVVASEVKQLVEQVGWATEQIGAEVARVQSTGIGSCGVIEGIATIVRDIRDQVIAVEVAINGQRP